MNYSQTNQNTKLNLYLSHFNAQEVDGILYFIVDLGIDGKQLWKTDGTTAGTVFVFNI